MRGRTGLAIAGGLVAVLVFFTVRDIADGTERPDPAPSPTAPALPEGVELVQVPRDGVLYDCVVYYNGGIHCWDTPARPAPTPTPGSIS